MSRHWGTIEIAGAVAAVCLLVAIAFVVGQKTRYSESEVDKRVSQRVMGVRQLYADQQKAALAAQAKKMRTTYTARAKKLEDAAFTRGQSEAQSQAKAEQQAKAKDLRKRFEEECRRIFVC
ncbi:MAG TPA: hypothetical protein VGO97_03970 [Solirubrobacterales bacterium]|nr:hypothetical protein [Solirubrobacterales bacterium]